MGEMDKRMRQTAAQWGLTLLFGMTSLMLLAQPAGLHTESKKAAKAYRKAMDSAKASLAPGADRIALEAEFESELMKALDLDPEFAEAERMLAALRFQQGAYEDARDRHAHVLERHGARWIRDHFGWSEAARHALDPEGMMDAMNAMQAVPGVLEGPDTTRIRRTLADAAFMREALAHPKDCDVKRLPPPVSTGEDEYFPGLWLAGDGLIFTRRVIDARWQQGQEDLFVARKEEGGWSIPQPLYGLNTLDNEGAASLSGQGASLCFTMCREADRPGQGAHKGSCDLYAARKTADGNWGRPVNLEGLNTSGWESQPCLSPDGRTIHFTRGRGRPGNRQHDLFVAELDESGRWGQAVRLPETINTSGQEMRPYLHPDGRHLYFASDGHPGMGGLDLFVCTLQEDGTWGEPLNLGWPLNTPDDESGLVVSSDGRTGYLSREVEGQLDLHVFQLPEEGAADPTGSMEGQLLSTDGTAIPLGRVTLIDAMTGAAFASGQCDPTGAYHVPVPLDRTFVVQAEAPGHLLRSERIEGGTLEGRTRRDIELQPLDAEAEVVLRNVFFESGSAQLKPSSHPELRQVAGWLVRNPGVLLEVGGHTDDVGSASNNRVLSLARAQSVVSFLTASGADAVQLEAVGYGQDRPAVQGQTEEARRQNRRTSLRVVSVD